VTRSNQNRQIDVSCGAGRAGSVLIIVENLPVPFDRRVWQEALALREAGYAVSVICPKGKGHDKTYEQTCGINIYRHNLREASSPIGYLREYSVALFWQFTLSVKILSRHGIDAIHACNPPDLIFLVALFHKILFGTRFLFDQHDLNPELYEVKFGRRGLFHRLLLMFERWTFRFADASLATNEALRDLAITRGHMPPDRVWMVKSYPDLAGYHPVQPNQSVRRGFAYLVGYVGIMAEQDGVDLLIRAMAYVIHQMRRTDVACLVIGDGPQYDQLVTIATDLGVNDYVRFTGYLSGDELLATLSACDIGVIPDPPNACNDKLSMNKVFEYMSLGLPFVQFDLAQARSEAGAASLVVDDTSPEALAEAIVGLLADEPARRGMSAYGKERARREFQWESEKKSLLNAYEFLLRPKDGRQVAEKAGAPAP
jgi:glycosyltransferase involved in cell wall biosynthesis